jgi:hypothetical protein
MTKTKTMTGKISYMPPPLVLRVNPLLHVCGCSGATGAKFVKKDKVEKISKGSLDSIPSPSLSVKIQIIEV